MNASLVDAEGRTLLMQAIRDEDLKMAQLLLSEEDFLETVNCQDNKDFLRCTTRSKLARERLCVRCSHLRVVCP